MNIHSAVLEFSTDRQTDMAQMPRAFIQILL